MTSTRDEAACRRSWSRPRLSSHSPARADAAYSGARQAAAVLQSTAPRGRLSLGSPDRSIVRVQDAPVTSTAGAPGRPYASSLTRVCPGPPYLDRARCLTHLLLAAVPGRQPHRLGQPEVRRHCRANGGIAGRAAKRAATVAAGARPRGAPLSSRPRRRCSSGKRQRGCPSVSAHRRRVALGRSERARKGMGRGGRGGVESPPSRARKETQHRQSGHANRGRSRELANS